MSAHDSLEVRLHTGPAGPGAVGPGGEPIGQRLVLPAGYVAEHLALAYASTVHAAQGRTTDTSHAVITGRTSHAALYVALSRGRDANTAHVATTTSIDDPAHGRPDQTVHRNPMSLLAGILTDRGRSAGQSATAIAAESANAADSVQSPGNGSPTPSSWPRPSAPPAGSISSPPPATSPPTSGPGSPPRTAPRRRRGRRPAAVAGAAPGRAGRARPA